jgi:hypothetical protein
VRDKNEIAKTVAVSTIKGLLTAVPFIGGALNEYAFEAIGRIKQERVNKFIIALSEYLAQFKEVQLSIDQIEKEDFGDFFEELIIKVSKNHSEIKKEAFKKLLVNQIRNPKSIDYALLYLDLISGLHEKEIIILEQLRIYASTCSSYINSHSQLYDKQNELKRFENQKCDQDYGIYGEDSLSAGGETHKLELMIEQAKASIEETRKRIKQYEKPYRPETYEIENEEFYFLIQDLCNKGLLIDHSIKYGEDHHMLVEVSSLGIDLLESLTETSE